MKIEEDLGVLLHSIRNELDLICRADEWLQQEKVALTCDIDEKVNELDKIFTAIKIKQLLQQKNKVAVKEILRTEHGGIKDIIVKIMSLPDAIDLLAQCKDDYDTTNFFEQMDTWKKDGYDLDKSYKIAKANNNSIKKLRKNQDNLIGKKRHEK